VRATRRRCDFAGRCTGDYLRHPAPSARHPRQRRYRTGNRLRSRPRTVCARLDRLASVAAGQSLPAVADEVSLITTDVHRGFIAVKTWLERRPYRNSSAVLLDRSSPPAGLRMTLNDISRQRQYLVCPLIYSPRREQRNQSAGNSLNQIDKEPISRWPHALAIVTWFTAAGGISILPPIGWRKCSGAGWMAR
jgi:hypothetical protein